MFVARPVEDVKSHVPVGSHRENGKNTKTCSGATAAVNVPSGLSLGILSQPSPIWLPAYYLSYHLLRLGAAAAAGTSLCMLNTSP